MLNFQALQSSKTTRLQYRLSLNNFCKGKCKYCFIQFQDEAATRYQDVALATKALHDLENYFEQIVIVIEDADPFVNQQSVDLCKKFADFATSSKVCAIEFFLNRKDSTSVANALQFLEFLKANYPEYCEKFCFSGTFLLPATSAAFIHEAKYALELARPFFEAGFSYTFNFAPQQPTSKIQSLDDLKQLALHFHTFACFFSPRKPTFSIAVLPASVEQSKALKSINDFSTQLQVEMMRWALLSLTEADLEPIAYLPFQQEGLVQALVAQSNCSSGLNCWDDSNFRLTVDGKNDSCLFPLNGVAYTSYAESHLRSPRRFQLQRYRAQLPFLLPESTVTSADSFFRGGCPFDRVLENNFQVRSESAELLAFRYQKQYQLFLEFGKHPVLLATQLLASAHLRGSFMLSQSFDARVDAWQKYLHLGNSALTF